MSEGMIGEVRLFAGNFAPRNWAFCHGQAMPIMENQALYSILGTTYGGDGRTTFCLPDLRGRVPLGFGDGPGLSRYSQGQRGGQETTTLSPQKVASGEDTEVVGYTGPSANNMQPFLSLNYIICIEGYFPSRS